MPALDLLAAAGCDLMLGCGLRLDCERPHVTVTTETDGGIRTTVRETPDGELIEKNAFDPYTNSWHPKRYPVQNAEDLKCLLWCCKDTEYAVPEAAVEKHAAAQEDLKRRGVFTTSGFSPSPLMALIEHFCGPENATYLMFDEPDLFEETLHAMHADRIRNLSALLAHLKSDSFWMTENTSTTLISPTMFENYAMPFLAEYGNMILEAGIIPVHHMCGTLNALLEPIDSLPALANEAYTTAPVGDVSLAEGRRRMPSKALIGGTNATLWLSEPEAIVEEVARDLRNAPDRRKIFLTSAGVLPPPVSFEKARAVVEMFKRLPV